MGLRKVLLIIAGATFACLLICSAVLFFSLRAARDSVHDDVASAITLALMDELNAKPRTANPVTVRLDANDLASRIAFQYSDEDLQVDDIVVRMESPNTIIIGLQVDTRDIVYRATLGVRDGKLDVTGISSSSALARFLLPNGEVAGGIEKGVNDVLTGQNYELQSVSTATDTLVLVLIPGGTSTTDGR
jgi:hypothetical protein